MLIQVPYKEGDVVSIKLSSGEEMIANLYKEEATTITVEKPMMIVAGEGGLGLAPYMFSVSPEAKTTLRLNSIICIVKTEENFAKNYTQQTSGIAV
jgi:hypothetical protein